MKVQNLYHVLTYGLLEMEKASIMKAFWEVMLRSIDNCPLKVGCVGIHIDSVLGQNYYLLKNVHIELLYLVSHEKVHDRDIHHCLSVLQHRNEGLVERRRCHGESSINENIQLG